MGDDLLPEFEDTAAFQWLATHATQYHFEMSFDRGNAMGAGPGRHNPPRHPYAFGTHVSYDKVRQNVTSKSKSKKHGPITGSD